jgi:hypothetical protein
MQRYRPEAPGFSAVTFPRPHRLVIVTTAVPAFSWVRRFYAAVKSARWLICGIHVSLFTAPFLAVRRQFYA